MQSLSRNNHRQLFPTLAKHAYFNFGGQGPLPTPALEAMYQAYQYLDEVTPFSQAAGEWSTKQAELTRTAIASELGVEPDTIALTEDVTVACNIALWGIQWQPGDRILLSDCEHPGIIAAVYEIQRRFQLDVEFFPIQDTLNAPDPWESVTRLTDALTPNTRMVILSHILWNTGQVIPLQAMIQACRQYTKARTPIQILVDAAQSVGVLPLNLAELDVDYYAFTGHKWWCGPAGVGGLYINPSRLTAPGRDRLHPTFIGWRGIVTAETGQPVGWQSGSRQFEVATSAIPLYVGLRTALNLHQGWGSATERYQALLTQSQALWASLSNLPGVQCLRTIAPPEAGLIAFQWAQQPTPKKHQQQVLALEERRVLLRTLKQPTCIRASVHYLTNEADRDRLLTELQKQLQT